MFWYQPENPEPLNPEKPKLDITIFSMVDRAVFNLLFKIQSSKQLILATGKLINGRIHAEISPEIAKLSGQYKPPNTTYYSVPNENVLIYIHLTIT